MEQFKMPCRVGAAGAGEWLEGLAHVVAQDYDGHFSPWYGCIDFSCPWGEAYGLAYRGVVLVLEDGRSGGVVLTGCGMDDVAVAAPGREVGRRVWGYFVGVTTLSVVPAPAAPSLG